MSSLDFLGGEATNEIYLLREVSSCFSYFFVVALSIHEDEEEKIRFVLIFISFSFSLNVIFLVSSFNFLVFLIFCPF